LAGCAATKKKVKVARDFLLTSMIPETFATTTVTVGGGGVKLIKPVRSRL
jgi:hypothetical protein